VSDVYYARVYRLAATRTGVTEYRELVDEKLRTAGELYEFMVDQFDETRSFALEVIVGILALIDVIFLFKR
jgi:predicted house-cleaning noncanonical NTP pyrophosphatase (MazG superfamily)